MAKKQDLSAMRPPTPGSGAARRPGRPRREISLSDVADAAAELFATNGYDAVSIESVAEKLSVSRATLYRTVPTKNHLLGILFEHSTDRLLKDAKALVNSTSDPQEALFGLVRVHVGSAVRMRRYMAVFFGGTDLPPEVVVRWRTWSRQYEKLWGSAVKQAMAAGVLDDGDPVLVTRLMLGMVIWVSRWYRPTERFTVDHIADAAISLISNKINIT